MAFGIDLEKVDGPSRNVLLADVVEAPDGNLELDQLVTPLAIHT